MKQITDEQSMERKSFENKMSHEYKLKKEMWKREMSDRETSKREREAILSQHKEQHRELEAANNQRLNRSQKETLDREVRKFRRRRLVKYHDLEQDLLREVRNKGSGVRQFILFKHSVKKMNLSLVGQST